MVNEHFFQRSFALIKRDRGWIKPLLALTAAEMVPLVGTLGVLGYNMEWARLVAWGADATPKQKNVRIGACIKAGWRAFVVMLVPLLVMGIILSLLRQVFAATGVALLIFLMSVISTAANALMSTAALVCALHATIYQDIKAGFSYKRIVSLIKADFGGIIRISVMNIAMSFVLGVVAAISMSVMLGTALNDLLSHYQMWAYDDVLAQVTWAEMFGFMADLMSQLSSCALPLALIILVMSLGAVVIQLITAGSVGLWLRKFDVPHWGPANTPIMQQAPAQLPYPSNMMR